MEQIIYLLNHDKSSGKGGILTMEPSMVGVYKYIIYNKVFFLGKFDTIFAIIVKKIIIFMKNMNS